MWQECMIAQRQFAELERMHGVLVKSKFRSARFTLEQAVKWDNDFGKMGNRGPVKI